MKKTWWQRFQLSSAHTQANIVCTIMITVATIAYSIIANSQLKAMRQTNELTVAALKQSAQNSIDASKQFQTQLGHFDAGLGRSDMLAIHAGEQAVAAGKSANAAEESAETAKESLHIAEGPFLVAPISGGRLRDTTTYNNAYPTVDMTYANIGRTPATSIVITAFIDLEGGSKLFPEPIYTGLTGDTLGAGLSHPNVIISTKERKHVDLRQFADVAHSRSFAGFSVLGYLQYKDVFGDPHSTAFCNFYPFNPSDANPPHQCEGNSNRFGVPPTVSKKAK